jgi:hypothetical protein
MKILQILSKTFNKSINKSLVIYQNNTRLIRNKKRNWEKKFMLEFKEYAYEIVSFLETRRGWWCKIFLLFFLFNPALQRSYWVLGGKKDKMLHAGKTIDILKNHQIEDKRPHAEDAKSVDKILYSYWINFV